MRPATRAPSVVDMPEKPVDQVWELVIDGRAHLVEARGSMNHQVRWYVDGDLVAEKKAMEDKLRLEAEERPELGALAVRFSWAGRGIRATVFDQRDQALAGLGGIDLVPEPGSKAAAYEDRIRLHPRRYAAIQTAVGVAKVVVPIIVAVLLARLAFRIPLPDWDLPDLPWPDLPDIPWPDLPSPNLPDVSVPGWVSWLLEKAKYVVPVLIAVGIAQGEIKRRQKQDQLRAEMRTKDREERAED
jgi:hypothetical protein